MYQTLQGDCAKVLKDFEENSIDAIITDPPYELGFMGKSWDSTGIAYSVDMWKEVLRVLKPGGHILSFSSARTYHRMVVAIEDAGFEIRDQIMWVYGQGFPKSLSVGDGLGTALKPAHEPIVLARKPMTTTIAENVSKYGTGAINIDATRIPGEPIPINKLESWSGFGQTTRPDYEQEMNTSGRFPSNFIHDGSEEVVRLFPPSKDRFFYCAKPNKKDKNEGLDEKNPHPTIKPTELMRYLVRMITPVGGTVLDPFMGSGSTGKASVLEGFNFIGIEQSQEYLDVANRRIEWAIKNKP